MADGESKRGKDRPYWLPFVIAFVMWAWLTYLFFYPDIVENTQFTFSEWVTIGYLVTVIMLVWLLIWKITLNTEVTTEAMAAATAIETAKKPQPKAKPVEIDEEEEEEVPQKAPAKPRKKRVVVATGSASAAAADLSHDVDLPEGLKRPEDVIDEDIEDLLRVVEYPNKEPGGVYSDTLLKVDDNLVLNYRILLGKVCHNCEELEDCKRRVEDKLDEDVFLFNFECKEGIKMELQKARKKRESDGEKAEAAKELVEEKAAKAKKAEEPTDDEGEPAEGMGEESTTKAPVKKKKTVKKKTSSKGKSKKSSSKKKSTAKK